MTNSHSEQFKLLSDNLTQQETTSATTQEECLITLNISAEFQPQKEDDENWNRHPGFMYV